MTPPGPLSAVPDDRRALIEAYVSALESENRSVNLVSRASSDRILDLHVAHSLALAHRRLRPGSRVVDWGTGGGLPAIPLAICFPDVEFVAVDSITKKARALERMVAVIGLENVHVWNGRAERFDGKAHYAVSRATASLDRLWAWTSGILEPFEASEGEWTGGLLALKGGDLSGELRRFRGTTTVETLDLARAFNRPDWVDKYIVHVMSGLAARP